MMLPRMLRPGLGRAALLARASAPLTCAGRHARPLSSSASWDEGKKRFEAHYPVVKQLIHDDVATFDMPPSSVEWIERLVEYSLPGGKLNRGTLVSLMAREMIQARGDVVMDEATELDCHTVGWCIELIQAAFLVADDMMDASTTRRGQPCYYKLPDVDTTAINDSFLLIAFAKRIIERTLGANRATGAFPAVQGHMSSLFDEVILTTELGQLLDTTSVALDEASMRRNFTPEYYTKIVHYKTADYTFYLPAASAMIIAGETRAEQHTRAREVCRALGEYFQIQDDYLDFYGDFNVTGKIGTDIEDRKCSWLAVQALAKCNEEQSARFVGAYTAAGHGADSAGAVQQVRGMFEELGMQEAYTAYEAKAAAGLRDSIAAFPDEAMRLPFEMLLGKLIGRKK